MSTIVSNEMERAMAGNVRRDEAPRIVDPVWHDVCAEARQIMADELRSPIL